MAESIHDVDDVLRVFVICMELGVMHW